MRLKGIYTNDVYTGDLQCFISYFLFSSLMPGTARYCICVAFFFDFPRKQSVRFKLASGSEQYGFDNG